MKARTLEEDLQLYKRAMQLATRLEEKKMILAGLASVSIPETAAYVKAFKKDDALKVEVEQALAKLSDTAPKAHVSQNPDYAKFPFDGSMDTWWDTRETQRAGQWYMVDLGRTRTIHKLTIKSPASPPNYAREYAVRVSANLRDWSEPVATGQGASVTEIVFAPQTTRYVVVERTGEPANEWWTICELEVE
jgi:hypothetical protein